MSAAEEAAAHRQRRAAFTASANRRVVVDSRRQEEGSQEEPEALRAPRGLDIGDREDAGAVFGSIPPPGMRRLRVTKFAVLLNTNVTSRDAGGVVVQALEDYLREDFWQPETLARNIPTRSGNPDHLLQIDIQAPTIEIGPKQGRVHSHFVVKVRHMDSVIISAVQSRMQAHVRAGPFPFAFVSVTLMNAKPENYALKEAYVSSD